MSVALFAGLLTKVGVYALIRVYSLLFVQDVGFTHTLILVISGAVLWTVGASEQRLAGAERTLATLRYSQAAEELETAAATR